MKKWKCTVCDYIHEGDSPPDECPVCGADSSAFVEVTDKAADEPKTEAAPDAAEASASVETPPAQTGTEEQREQKPAASPQSLWTSLFAKATELILKHHLHPIAVHSPNGIMPMAFVFLLIAALLGASSFDLAAFYSLVFILISMPLVIFTGYGAWQKRYRGALTPVFKIKIACSAVVLFCLVLLIVWRLVDPGVLLTSASRWLYLLFALICLSAVGMAGHLGGKLLMGSRK